jgi:hypothetical protein
MAPSITCYTIVSSCNAFTVHKHGNGKRLFVKVSKFCSLERCLSWVTPLSPCNTPCVHRPAACPTRVSKVCLSWGARRSPTPQWNPGPAPPLSPSQVHGARGSNSIHGRDDALSVMSGYRVWGGRREAGGNGPCSRFVTGRGPSVRNDAHAPPTNETPGQRRELAVGAVPRRRRDLVARSCGAT